MARAIALRKVSPMQIGPVYIDSCLEETHQFNNQVTDHPVESGANISDHSRPEPDRVTLRCFISNTPLSDQQQKTARRTGSFTRLRTTNVSDSGFSWETTAPEAVDGRGENAFKELIKMREEGALITVVTTLKTYAVKKDEGMMIESITIPVTRENFDGLEFTLTLKKVRLVRTRTTTVSADRRVQKKKTKKGGQATKEPEERKKTLLKRGVDFFRG